MNIEEQVLDESIENEMILGLNIKTPDIYNSNTGDEGEESMHDLCERIAANMWNNYQMYINHAIGEDD